MEAPWQRRSEVANAWCIAQANQQASVPYHNTGQRQQPPRKHSHRCRGHVKQVRRHPGVTKLSPSCTRCHQTARTWGLMVRPRACALLWELLSSSTAASL